jgi:hypothetical protein
LNKKRLDQKLIMARSGGVVNLFAANFKFNRLNDLRHSVAAVKLEPPDLRRHHQCPSVEGALAWRLHPSYASWAA